MTDHPVLNDSQRLVAALLADPLEEAVLFELIPELYPLQGCQQPPYHTEDVWTHTLLVVHAVAPIPLLRIAALLHDIAKPLVKTGDDTVSHFYGHELVGAELANTILLRLGFGENFRKNIVRMIALHMRFNKYKEDWGSKGVHRLRRDASMFLFQPCILLAIADCSSDKKETKEEAQQRLMHLYDRAYSFPSGNSTHRSAAKSHPLSPLNGIELQKLAQGQGPGKWIESVKAYLEKEVVAGRLDGSDKERAREIAKAFMQRAFSWYSNA